MLMYLVAIKQLFLVSVRICQSSIIIQAVFLWLPMSFGIVVTTYCTLVVISPLFCTYWWFGTYPWFVTCPWFGTYPWLGTSWRYMHSFGPIPYYLSLGFPANWQLLLVILSPNLVTRPVQRFLMPRAKKNSNAHRANALTVQVKQVNMPYKFLKQNTRVKFAWIHKNWNCIPLKVMLGSKLFSNWISLKFLKKTTTKLN